MPQIHVGKYCKKSREITISRWSYKCCPVKLDDHNMAVSRVFALKTPFVFANDSTQNITGQIMKEVYRRWNILVIQMKPAQRILHISISRCDPVGRISLTSAPEYQSAFECNRSIVTAVTEP